MANKPKRGIDFDREQLQRWADHAAAAIAERHGFEPEEPLADNAFFYCLLARAASRGLSSHDETWASALREDFVRDLATQTSVDDDEIADGLIGYLLTTPQDVPGMFAPTRAGLVFGATLVAGTAAALFFQPKARAKLAELVFDLDAWLFPLVDWLTNPYNALHGIALALTAWLILEIVARKARKAMIMVRARQATTILASLKPWLKRVDWKRLPRETAAGVVGLVVVSLALAVSGGLGALAYLLASFASGGSEWAPYAWFGVIALGSACLQLAWVESLAALEDDPRERLLQEIRDWRGPQDDPDKNAQ